MKSSILNDPSLDLRGKPVSPEQISGDEYVRKVHREESADKLKHTDAFRKYLFQAVE